MSLAEFPFLAQRLFNTPVLIHPAKADIIITALADRLGIVSVAHLGGMAMMDQDDERDDFQRRQRTVTTDDGYDLVGDVAVIAVRGTLVQRLGSLRPYSGMTGYNGIRQAFLTAMVDPAAKGIMLDIDSPGGDVAGCFDLVDTIWQARGQKPVWAVLNEHACSAAYAIASAADRVTVPRTGVTGSIGAIVVHLDLSEALAKAGIRPVIIAKGACKPDGQPGVPLSDEALARIQAQIDTVGALFDETVARNRSMPVAKVTATEAATFMGAAGVTAGLADAVMAPDAAFRAFVKSL